MTQMACVVGTCGDFFCPFHLETTMNTSEPRFFWPDNDNTNRPPDGGRLIHLDAGEANGIHACSQPRAYTHGHGPDAPPDGQNLLPPPCTFEIRQNESGRGGYIVVIDLFGDDSGPMLVFD
jgi:hypothetical protein